MLNPADDLFIAELAAHLPAGTLRPPEPRHLEEPRGHWQGGGGVLALPRCTGEVATIVGHCAAGRVPVVPRGGGTGLVGGQVCPDGPAPVILSLERMDAVRAVHAAENTIVVEAGMTLAAVREAAADAGRRFPLSLASEGSARIGGCLATNAGGINVLRWGNARDLCLGVEAVMADGRVLGGLKRLRKDNTGYDLRNLLIGSEGTLGIITAAALRLVAPPASEGTALLAVPDPGAALGLLALAETRAAGCVSAFELIAGGAFGLLAETVPEARRLLEPVPDWAVLVELGLPAGLDAGTALEELYSEAAAAGLAGDGVIARSEGQRAELWRMRELLPEASRRVGAVSNHDIALPLGALPAFLDEVDAAIARIGPFRLAPFGHLGDGNLHYNVFPPKGGRRSDYPEDMRAEIKRTVHDIVHAMGGSISAEHGIGRFKVDDLERYGDPVKLSAMRAIKAALDPHGIMNPGAVLRPGG
ncbi:MAG: FAD-binding oxidoreductase [Rhodobacteraceae bacterium]|nr:FAD-binding oxidoreductase [Paracoccaceae bacterium]